VITVRLLGLLATSLLVPSTLRAQDAKIVADNLTYSRDFYSKVHFVAIANLPVSFKYDRYPSGGPERIQCYDGTYTRQHGKPWVHSNDKMRAGLPIDYPERNRYVMTFASREDWGRTGEAVDKETARKLDGWIKLVEAALNVTPTNAKLLGKSETTDGRDQWVFEVPSEANGVPTRFTFRKRISDKNENVLLHEFSGPLRLDGDKVVPGWAADSVRFGLGYMRRGPQGIEVSEFVWEEMQQDSGGEARSPAEGSLSAPAAPTHSNPKEASSYNERGTAKDKNGDFDGAIADYTRAIELNPKFSEAYYNRGLAKKHKGELDGAIADYNRVIEMNPKNPKYARAYCDRGVAKRRKGDVDGAISDYNRTIELDSKYAIAYFNRGNAKDEKGDSDAALADYNRGIELNPKDPKAYANRADVYSKKKEYDAAIKDLEKAIGLDPKNGDYYLSLGWCQLFNRKPRESIAASLKALKLSPNDVVMINGNLAHGYLFDNQFEKAKAIYLENKDAELHDGRAFSQTVLDDFKELEEAGITHPDMEKIKALLTTKAEQ
jgi:tetratricopeptide (TPR) repeat protein